MTREGIIVGIIGVFLMLLALAGTVSALSANEANVTPEIVSILPDSTTVNNNVGEMRTFIVTANQEVNVSWFINGTLVQSNTSVTTSAYINDSAAMGSWNVTAIASNDKSIDEHNWDWTVRSLPPVQIELLNFAFNPANITIQKGTTVIWTNNDSAQHTVTSDIAGIFNSGSLNQGDSFEWTFNETGTFNYHCNFHPSMQGKVIVISAPTPIQPPVEEIGIDLELVAENFTAPIALVSPDDGTGRRFIVDQIGVIKILTDDGQILQEPFMDIRSRIVNLRPQYDERGLLGLAFHPNFRQNGLFYVYYSAPLRPEAPANWDATSIISEFRVLEDNLNKTNESSERIILQVDKPQSNHNAGQIAFGPDGYLYIPIGDGGNANDVGIGHPPPGNAQNISTLLGKILRIDVDNGTSYGIPPDNPFVGKDGQDEIFAYGFRNPFHIAFDAGGNHSLFVSDAGQNAWEEMNIVTNGGNYGWNLKEGTHCFDPNNPNLAPSSCPDVSASGQPLIDPVIEYANARQAGGLGVVVVGGFVYRGNLMPQFNGDYLFGDFSKGFIEGNGSLFVARPTGQNIWSINELKIASSKSGRIEAFVRSFGQDADHEIYVMTSQMLGPVNNTGKVFKIKPVEAAVAPEITSFIPEKSNVTDIAGGPTRTFTINVNQIVNVSWQINGEKVSSQTNVNASFYSNASAAPGIWNVTAIASNPKGSDVHIWTWTVKKQIIGDGSISGMKFNDSNGNGIKDPGESGLSNWTIALKNNTGSLVETMMTDIDGNYTFGGLEAGNYTVDEVFQAGWKQTFPETPGTYNVTLASGENVTGMDFGNNLMPFMSSELNATREIEKESLRLGESTKITVTISSNVIQALALKESIPEGWKLTRISDDADKFKDSTNEWAWSNVTPGIAKKVVYSITPPVETAIGTYYINGTLTNSSGIVDVVGNNIITLDIYAYYRRLGSEPDRLETRDLLRAMDDWNTGTIPAGFAQPITFMELSALMDEWATEVIPAAFKITSFTPSKKEVIDAVNTNRTFKITVNQKADIKWLINGTEVFNESDVTTSSYENTSSVPRIWNVTSVASNSGGSDMRTWIWIITGEQEPDNADKMIKEGKNIFRFDTFGDEAFWGDTLKLHKAIAGTSNGGAGPGVSPKTALAVGLKVDVDALPQSLIEDIKKGKVDLDDPATTLALLKLDAVVGVKGIFNKSGVIKSIGITCAICHSTVDDSLAPGIGHRLDGWANRDLNVGAIVNLSPDLSPVAHLLGTDETTVRTVLNSWGPGKFDAELFLDGEAFNPKQVTDGVVTGKNISGATLIPNAYGLAGFNQVTWTGAWGSVPYWNAFVANIEMHGKGTFFDPRLDDASKFPIAAANKFGHMSSNPDDDQITSKLPALQFYQLSLGSPVPQPGKDFDKDAAARGDELFSGKARCNNCHSEPLWTEPGRNLHKPSEIGIDSFQADRAPDGLYKTMNLGGIFVRENGKFMKPENKGRFYHDGRFKTLLDVVDHYDKLLKLNLSDQEKGDVVEYLKSLSSKSNKIMEGRQIFRFDTFGDEAFWGDTLKLHQGVANVSPKTALAVGLKVDMDALPQSLIEDIKKGKVDLDDPATTLALLKLDAVVGVKGIFNKSGIIKSIGITCAICHSTVDDSLAPGIGHRLDGWANRDLNVGAIVNLSPDLSPVAHLLGTDETTVRTVLNSWGPGKFDAELFLDGKAFNPEQVTDGVVTGRNVSGATLIPNAYGLAGFDQATWTGAWGSVPYWNAFVANIEMHGKGTFFDPRLDNASKYPIAAANKLGNIRANPDDDQITSKLPALQFYQLSLSSPVPQPGKDFDKDAAARGDELFSDKARCNNCHSEPLWTEPGWNLHKPSEIGIDSFQADRAPDGLYKTMNLGGIFVRENGKFMKPENKGRFYHDGRFSTLLEVVDHYDKLLKLNLSDQEKGDVVEYLKSLSSP